ncbi:hypothetical protein BXZ70DRAFT_674671 [Cristinia sonorae]|uniref:Nitrogen regulatory protein areA GATA-like domain-containing protein n=1 Tax=Cristinia sonorae TaxID=1940300 RepID=A0A8K0XT58_9AGAR|nr:hypothetical protein BXZ70DRAFT_674671 [Cristinia sonorae]
MPVPATLTSYLPTLLVSVSNNVVPDDSSLSTLAQGQVDYLSHEWREEDVWQSWRHMTRQKNAVANGTRLENASWRTWWKQRNKLKTISPETLNWLKDSDVTWLYGPLHIGSDWIKPVEHPPVHIRKNSISNGEASRSATISHSPSPNAMGKKPILKRRSISQLLSLPASPFFDHDDSEEDEDEEDDTAPARPLLMHTKSDTHISWRSRPYRKDSPPRITAADLHQEPQTESHSETTDSLGLRSMTSSSDASNSTGSDQDLSAESSTGAEVGGKKKHISFNTFVEQCIAIEKPKSKRKKSFVGSRNDHLGFFPNSGYDDGYDEDSEVGYEYDSDEPESASFYVGDRSVGSDSEDEDDDVLEMRTSSSRSRSSSSSRSRHSPLAGADNYDARNTSPQSLAASSRARPPLVRQGSTDRERVTIAPIAPTTLKTIGVGNNLASFHEGRSHVSKEVELVYLPPSNSIYSLPSTPLAGVEELHHHSESYFAVGGPSSLPTRHSPLVHNSFLPHPHPDNHASSSSSRHYSNTNSHHIIFGPHQRSLVDSPHMMEEPSAYPDAYDYFGGPDLGEDFGDRMERRQHTRRRRSYSDAGNDDLVGLHDGSGMLRYAQGGAASVTTGRSSMGGDHHWPGVVGAQVGASSPRSVPSVIVNEAAGAFEERAETSLCASPLSVSPPTAPNAMPIAIKTTPVHELGGMAFGHSPNNPSPVARMLGSVNPSSYPRRQDSDASYLSPPDASNPSRGRSPQRSSHSGSTTTGSYSHSSDSRSGSRGRSSTRTSSFSDHERSGSRGSRGTNSPLGSISPTGSSAAVAGGGRGRERESRAIKKSSTEGDEERRGRDRSGRKLGESISPPHVVGTPSRNTSDLGDYQPYTPELLGAHLEKMDKQEKKDKAASGTTSPPSSISGSSTASSATIGPSEASETRTIRRPIVPSLPIPSPIPEEDETARSKQPTPANSPIATLSLQPSVLPIPVPPVLQASPPTTPPTHQFARAPKTPPVLPVTSPSAATATGTTSPPLSPTNLQRSSERVIKGIAEEGQPGGTLVGRAAEIVSSARGFLGSIWSTGGN